MKMDTRIQGNRRAALILFFALPLLASCSEAPIPADAGTDYFVGFYRSESKLLAVFASGDGTRFAVLPGISHPLVRNRRSDNPGDFMIPRMVDEPLFPLSFSGRRDGRAARVRLRGGKDGLGVFERVPADEEVVPFSYSCTDIVWEDGNLTATCKDSDGWEARVRLPQADKATKPIYNCGGYLHEGLCPGYVGAHGGETIGPDERCSDHPYSAVPTIPDTALRFAISQTLPRYLMADFTCGTIWQLSGLSLTNGSDLESLAGIQNLPNLSSLTAQINSRCRVKSGSGCYGDNIIYINGDVEDLSPLAGNPKLSHLELGYQRIKDISALSGLKRLRYLDLRGNAEISDISALRNLPYLQQLYFDGVSSLTDIQPLIDNSDIGRGTSVYLWGTGVSCADMDQLRKKGVDVYPTANDCGKGS
jgi:hypothetical protein